MIKNTTNSAIQRLVNTARDLTEACIPIVLLRPGRKSPIEGSGGSWVVVTEPEDANTFVEWATRSGPVNIGAVLAPKFDSHLIVVDVDSPSAWPQVRELGLSSADPVWISKTGKGGQHIFYYADESPPPRVIRAGGSAIDLLSDGYVVLPPSNTRLEAKGGGSYSWVPGHSPGEIPLAVLAPPPYLLLKRWWQCATKPEPHGLWEGEKPKLLHLLSDTIPEGHRNDALTRVCGWLRLYHPHRFVEALLLAINDARCRPPLDARDVRAIVRSINRYPQPGLNGHPRAVIPSFVRHEVTHE